MQTLFDHCIKDLIVISLSSTQVTSLVTLGWVPVRGNLYGGMLVMYFHMWSSILMFGQLILTMITRYLLIFHSVSMSNVNDFNFIFASRLSIFLLASLSMIGEHFTSDFWRSITLADMTRIQPEDGIKSVNIYFIKGWVFAIIFVVGYVMVRIELLKLKFGQKSTKKETRFVFSKVPIM